VCWSGGYCGVMSTPVSFYWCVFVVSSPWCGVSRLLVEFLHVPVPLCRVDLCLFAASLSLTFAASKWWSGSQYAVLNDLT
jgi:hypothetical protein